MQDIDLIDRLSYIVDRVDERETPLEIPRVIFENVAYGCRDIGRQGNSALKTAGELIMSWPSYDATHDGTTFSMGLAIPPMASPRDDGLLLYAQRFTRVENRRRSVRGSEWMGAYMERSGIITAFYDTNAYQSWPSGKIENGHHWVALHQFFPPGHAHPMPYPRSLQEARATFGVHFTDRGVQWTDNAAIVPKLIMLCVETYLDSELQLRLEQDPDW